MSAHEAGRELDALIEERVFGRVPQWRTIRAARGDYRALVDVPFYSIESAAAWLVVEKMRDMKWWPEVKWVEDWDRVAKWYVALHRPPHLWSATAPDAPLAICRAALVALEAA